MHPMLTAIIIGTVIGLTGCAVWWLLVDATWMQHGLQTLSNPRVAGLICGYTIR
jgi:hypothetical protein